MSTTVLAHLDVDATATRIAGLDQRSANALFGGGFQSAAALQAVTAEQAAKAIDNVIECGDPKWREVLANGD